MTPIKLARYKTTNPEIEVFTKCYDYGSSSWLFTMIILVIIVVLTVLMSIYCFYWRKHAKVKPHMKMKIKNQ